MKTLDGLYLPCLLLCTSMWAQEPRTNGAAIEGIKGVKQDAVESVKKVEPPAVTPPPVIPPTVTPTAHAAPVTNNAQAVEKVQGVDKIDGVKASGRDAVAPIAPKPAGSAASVGGDTVGSATTIHAVQGVTGIQALKRQNLEAALLMKEGGGGTPAGGGAEKGGKGKAAAAALLAAPLDKAPAKPGPTQDGRSVLQEFEKRLNTGS